MGKPQVFPVMLMSLYKSNYKLSQDETACFRLSQKWRKCTDISFRYVSEPRKRGNQFFGDMFVFPSRFLSGNSVSRLRCVSGT